MKRAGRLLERINARGIERLNKTIRIDDSLAAIRMEDMGQTTPTVVKTRGTTDRAIETTGEDSTATAIVEETEVIGAEVPDLIVLSSRSYHTIFRSARRAKRLCSRGAAVASIAEKAPESAGTERNRKNLRTSLQIYRFRLPIKPHREFTVL